MVVYAIDIALITLIPIILVNYFVRIDKEYAPALKLTSTRKIGLAMLILAGLVALLSPGYCYLSTLQHLNSSFILAYLIFMSYTDTHTKMLYSVVSAVMLVFEIIITMINAERFQSDTYTLIIALGVLIILAIFNLIGAGDVLIYTVIMLYLLQNRTVPTMSFILNVLMTNIMFVVVTVLKKLQSKDINILHSHEPLTLFIYFGTLMTICLYI